MKSLFQFLNEAQSQASMQAKKLNLKSDGHGGWLDSKGKFVATTEDGKLKPMNVKEGDKILFGKWSGTEVKLDGQDLLIMKESDIMGILE